MAFDCLYNRLEDLLMLEKVHVTAVFAKR